MTEDNWQRVHAVLQDALERSPSERAAYLDEACQGDPGLRSEVESLLDSAVARGRFDRLAEGFGVMDDETVPDHVGPYRIRREVGRGGMGVVYLGERGDDHLGRPVALKVFHRGDRHADLTERFLAEREILSRLDHPNIARLFSGGVTDDGRPYFAMEYVEGRPITDHCDVHRLDIDSRLRLFVDVGAAVQHAHRHLVVHRDIKPSNILVTEDGHVKLLDFGIAKLLDDSALLGDVPLTRSAVRLMTPEYASPEQVRGEAITTATDVYQLGVLLYELLTGRRPYRLPKRLVHVVEQAICEQPPERPSAVLTRDAGPDGGVSGAAWDASRARGTTAERLRRRLAGDLDTIVLMAMRKEPERRYGSVAALVDDLKRHLDGLPVGARPDTLGYRAAKFVRRHRIGVSTAAAVGVLVVGFGVTLAAQAGRIARESARAERVTEFLVELFENADPDASTNGLPTVRDVLDDGVLRIRYDLHQQPLVRASVLDAMGRAYMGLGLAEEARPLLEEALDLRRERLGPDHPDVLLSRWGLARIASDRAQGPEDRDAARVRLEEVLNGLQRHYGERHLLVAEAHSDLGLTLQLAGAYEEARAQYDSALATLGILDGPDAREQQAVTMSNLGWLAQARGDLAAADSLFQVVLELRRGLYPGDHPRLANSLRSLADIRNRRGDAAGAEPLIREALAMLERIYPEPHPLRANALLGLANVMQSRGDPVAADSAYRASLDVLRDVLPGDDERVARVLNDRASLHAGLGDPEQADSLYRAAAVLFGRILGEDHPFTLIVEGNVADMKRQLGQLDQAEAMYRSIIPRVEATVAGDSMQLAPLLTGLGNTLLQKDQPGEAEELLRRSYDMQRNALAETHTHRLTAQGLLGDCLVRLGQYGEAEEILRAYHDVVSESWGWDNTYARWARGLLVTVYERLGRPEEANLYRDRAPDGAGSR